MKAAITILTLFISFQIFGQAVVFFKTTGKKNLHYLEFKKDSVKVYKMGFYVDVAGEGSAIILTDTLVFTKENEWRGSQYRLTRKENQYTLLSRSGKAYKTEPETNMDKVNTELNNAYYLKSYFDLSKKLNKEFPLNYFSFRNGYSAWHKQPNKAIGHDQFCTQTDKEMASMYKSISGKHTALTKTTDFIINHAKDVDYSILKDSIRTLPMEYQSQSRYFDNSVYQTVKTNPVYFYKLLQDFPTGKRLIYSAVNHDKELVQQLKQVQGYDALKKEFFKDYKFGKTILYKIVGMYAIIAGLLTWLIVAQP